MLLLLPKSIVVVVLAVVVAEVGAICHLLQQCGENKGKGLRFVLSVVFQVFLDQFGLSHFGISISKRVFDI